jgi:hypothetical protein
MEYYKILDLADIEYFCEYNFIWKIEEWRNVVGHEKLYKVSDLGRVKSFRFNKETILRGWKDTYGYRTITFRENKVLKPRTVHRMMAESFLNHIPNGTNEIVVDHKNNISTDNRLGNLQLITNRENSSKDRENKSSDFIGVTWNKKVEKWKSQISIDKKRMGLGYFTNEIDAVKAYQNKLNSLTTKTSIV